MALYHIAKGPVNYTVVGNPTIVDGVMTGDSGYIEINSTASLWSQNSFEVVYSFETGNRNEIPESTLFTLYRQKLDDSGIQLGGGYYSPANKTLYLFFGYDGNGNSNESFVVIQDNTKYKIKFAKNNSTGYMAVSTNGGNFTVLGTYDVSDTKAYSVNQSIYAITGISQLLNETYITVNGQPLFGNCPVEVKRHQIMGPVGYTVVGNPTIVDGVVSGFSGSNYAQMTSSINIGTGENFEFNIKFKTGAQITQNNPLFTVGYDGIGYAAGINVTSNKVILWQLFNIGGEKSLGSVALDSTYVLSIKRTNGQDIVSNLYKEGVLVNTTSWTSNAGESTNDLVRICRSYTGDMSYFQGSIDFNHTYIKVNNELWFYQPQETKYIIREDKLVWADPRIALSGPVNYEVVGSPTIVDGVANVDENNYLNISNNFDASNYNNLEFYCRLKMPTTMSPGWGVAFRGMDWNANGFFGFYNEEEEGAYRIFGVFGLEFGYQVTEDTWYRIKCVVSNNMQEVYFYDDNETLLGSATGNRSIDTTYLRIGSHPNNSPLVDLNETYIKVNGELWFYGKNYASGNIAPVPSGFTYGNTTTDRIGWVDMRDQSYHQAPAGTCLVSGSGSTTYDDYVIEDNKLVAVNPNIYWENLTGGGGGSDFAYIDAGFKPTNKTAFDFAYTQKGNAGNAAPFMVSAVTVDGVSYKGFGYVAEYGEFSYFDNRTNISPASMGTKGIYVSELTSSAYNVTSEATSTTTSLNLVSDQSTYNNLYLGCWNYGYSDGSHIPFYPMIGRLYYAKFYENGVLIRHFVPVPAGLVIGNFTVPSNGMFDMVNQQFYANQGTGEFTIGRDE